MFPTDEVTRHNLQTLMKQADKLADEVLDLDGYTKDEPMVKVEGVDCIPIPYGEFWQMVNVAKLLRAFTLDMGRAYGTSEK